MKSWGAVTVGEINYYDILGVAPGAAAQEVRAAYLARIAEYHPDRNGATHASAITALVNEAWEVIGDAERRREYDAKRAAPFGRTSTALAPRTTASSLTRGALAKFVGPAKAATTAEHRRDTRLKTLFTVWVATPPSMGRTFRANCTCVDLSPNGLAFALPSRLRSGTLVRSWAVPPFRIYYQRHSGELLIVRVYHQTRRPITR